MAYIEDFSQSTPTGDIIDKIVSTLGLDKTEAGISTKKEEWKNALKNNMVSSLGLLLRLSPDSISKLSIPILIQDELKKLIASFGSSAPLLKVAPTAPWEVPREHYPWVVHPDSFENGKRSIVLPSTPLEPFVESQDHLATITPKQRELIQNSWKWLLMLQDFDNNANSGLFRFFLRVYEVLFEKNAVARRLFEGRTVTEHRNVMQKTINYIFQCVDNSPAVKEGNIQLAGRHFAYGLDRKDLHEFNAIMVFCLQEILGARFNYDFAEAWTKALGAVADFMTVIGNKAKKGFEGTLSREGDAGKWRKFYARLDFDALILFADPAFKEQKGRFPIHNVAGITFPKSTEPNCFNLHCPVTPFDIILSAETPAQLNAWVEQITWRVEALKRSRPKVAEARNTSASVPIEEESSHSSQHKSKSATKKPHSGKGKTSSGTSSTNEMLDINLTPDQYKGLKNSWDTLISNRDKTDPSKSGLHKFMDKFFVTFLAGNATGSRLFKDDGVFDQIRSLIKMVAFMLKAAEDPASVTAAALLSLGGRHRIYGVDESDFKQFGEIFVKSLGEVLTPDVFTEAVKSSWLHVISALSTVMLSYGARIAHAPIKIPVYRLKSNKKWKKTMIGLSLTTLNLYEDQDGSKLKTALDIKEVGGVVNAMDDDVTPPTVFFLTINMGLSSNKIALAVETQALLDKLLEELAWRVSSSRRNAPEVDDSISGSEKATREKSGKSIFSARPKLSTAKSSDNNLKGSSSGKIQIAQGRQSGSNGSLPNKNQ